MTIIFIIFAWLMENVILIQRLTASKGSLVNIITAVAAIISPLVSLIVALLVNRQSKKQFFVGVVSNERLKWNAEMRALCAELCGLCEQYDNEAAMSAEQIAAFYKTRNAMLLKLNPPMRSALPVAYPVDERLIHLLEQKTFAEVKASVPEIRKCCMIIFKSEWDKVKIEVGNSKSVVKKIEAYQQKINSANDSGDGAQ